VTAVSHQSLTTIYRNILTPFRYLHVLDRILERRQLESRLGATLVRYADDCVVLCRRDVERSQAVLVRMLERLGLSLNESKTRGVDASVESFDFLGFELRMYKGEEHRKAVCGRTACTV